VNLLGAILGIGVALIVGVGVLFLLLGWVMPLIIAGIWRRRGLPGSRGWRVFAACWACLSLVFVVGAASLAMLSMRTVRSGFTGGSSGAPVFDPAKHHGATATLRTASPCEATLTACAGSGPQQTFRSTNGAFTVPAGSLRVTGYTVNARDAGRRTWTAQARIWQGPSLTLEPGAVRDVGLGPPFSAGVEATCSGASRTFKASPACFDRDGNAYQIAPSPAGDFAPSFQFLDASGAVVWTEKFEHG
jgi:hypothetical protein